MLGIRPQSQWDPNYDAANYILSLLKNLSIVGFAFAPLKFNMLGQALIDHCKNMIGVGFGTWTREMLYIKFLISSINILYDY